MGNPTQKRIIRRIDLERFLSQVKTFQNPSAKLEQYAVSEKVAGILLFLATYVDGNIINKRVLDLGCGTGRLALGAAFLGAQHVVGVDIDRNAIKIALENSLKVGLKNRVSWVNGTLDVISGNLTLFCRILPLAFGPSMPQRSFTSEWHPLFHLILPHCVELIETRVLDPLHLLQHRHSETTNLL